MATHFEGVWPNAPILNEAERTPKSLCRFIRFQHGCGSAWKRDPGNGVIGVEKGPLIPVV